MKTIAVSKFKATCLALLERVMKTGQPILITKQGRPLAQVVPPPPPGKKESWLGSGAHSARIKGDLIQPVTLPEDWSALKK